MPESPGRDARVCPRHGDLKGQQEDSEDWRTGLEGHLRLPWEAPRNKLCPLCQTPPKHTILSSHQIKPEGDI